MSNYPRGLFSNDTPQCPVVYLTNAEGISFKKVKIMAQHDEIPKPTASMASESAVANIAAGNQADSPCARRFCGHPMKTHSESQCESPDWSDRGISMRQHCLCPGYPSVPELNREGTEVKF